jgi:hypothetical protein
MATLLEMKARAESLKGGFIGNAIQEIFIERKDDIIHYNTDVQLYAKGIGSDGKKLEPMYKPSTIAMKKRLNLPSGHVTLFQKGKFYAGEDIDATESEATFVNYDPKFPKLAEKYGDKILGLTPENWRIVNNEIIAPGVLGKIKNRLLP